MTNEEIKRLQDENSYLKQEVERLKDEMVRLVSRNLDLSEQLECNIELFRRTALSCTAAHRWRAKYWRATWSGSAMPTCRTTVS